MRLRLFANIVYNSLALDAIGDFLALPVGAVSVLLQAPRTEHLRRVGRFPLRFRTCVLGL